MFYFFITPNFLPCFFCAMLDCCVVIKVLHHFAEASGTLELKRNQTATEPQPVCTYVFI